MMIKRATGRIEHFSATMEEELKHQEPKKTENLNEKTTETTIETEETFECPKELIKED